MPSSAQAAWERLLQPDAFRHEGSFPIPAYSERMPGPFVALKPSGAIDPTIVPRDDGHGFLVPAWDEAHQLRPGLARVARHLAIEIRKLAKGRPGLSKALLADNPYWPEALAERVSSAAPRRLLLLVPLALSRTQDDKGRVCWTLFGASEQGPARPFWQSFYTAPGVEVPESRVIECFRRLVADASGSAAEAEDLSRSGFRILPADRDPEFPLWGAEPIPRAAQRFLIGEHDPVGGVRWLLTFRPFARLPPQVQRAHLDGALELLPFPGSLVFFGHQGYRTLARQLPLAMQIPLLHLFPGSHAGIGGLRIPQSGWLEEPRPHGALPAAPAHAHGPVVSHVKRTHRWNRTHRDEDETTVLAHEDRVAHALFSNAPEDLGLYGKPMARNAQVWTVDHRLLLDGPVCDRGRIDEAAHAFAAGGHFGYRFQFPPMQIGSHDVYWHRPLWAAVPPEETAEPAVRLDGPSGYLTAYPTSDPAAALATPIELWPRPDRREAHLDAAELFEQDPGHRRHTTAYNARKLLDAHVALGERPLSRSFARRLLTAPKDAALEEWLDGLAERSADPARGRRLAAHLRSLIEPAAAPGAADFGGQPPASLTFARTARRELEERYWRTIAALAEGRFRSKDNADPAVNPAHRPNGRQNDPGAARDLEALGDSLLSQHRAIIERHGMIGNAVVAEHRFRWRTELDLPWSGGWARNQTGQAHERNLLVLIPGRDRSEAVILADHYDTAYMEDVYEQARGGDLTRRAAAGADDNHSATAALLMAADVLLPLSREGRLARDVWLVHLTGEEFPSDCLGARNLVQRLVERTLAVEADGAGWLDLSQVRVRGAFIMDMIAHNNDRDRYVFQIAPGEGAAAMRLALAAHEANERWNRSTATWNRAPGRAQPGPSRRVESGDDVPPTVAHPRLAGEIRPGWHFASSLYNTDAQIFSDAGIPVVLLMESYDIDRAGYHDTQDTMKNIDLDYGAALAAIAIEATAQVAAAE